MFERKRPCLTYLRLRDDDRRANSFAWERQRLTERLILEEGYEFMGGLGDPESADLYCGWLEPRFGRQHACEEAKRIARDYGSCTILILQGDGLGTGDQFLPALEDVPKNVKVRVCAFGLHSRGSSTSLKNAHRRFDQYKSAVRARHAAECTPIRPEAGAELIFVPDHRQKHTRVMYRNPGDQPLQVRLQTYTRPLGQDGAWAPASARDGYTVPPMSASHLTTFFQGEAQGEAIWWRFRTGKGSNTWASSVIVTPADILRGSIKLRWEPYTPERLRPHDFHWEGRPSLQTRRLLIRNWQPDDAAEYAKHCNTNEVMRFLGGRQSAAKVREDLEYFAALGEKGPTYWAVERIHDSALLGFCGAVEVEEPDSPVHGEMEIGWRFRRDCWGQGFAYEAAAEVLRALFEELGAEEVISRIDPRNVASVRIAERLGMRERECRRHRRGDGDQVLHVYEMNKQRYWAGATSRQP